MEGKKSLKHLYNPGSSTQIKAVDFIDFIRWLDTSAEKKISQATFQISEKMDGAPIYFGEDEIGFYMEKFAVKDKIRNEVVFEGNPYLLPYLGLFNYAKSNKEFRTFLTDLKEKEQTNNIKIVFETLLKSANKEKDELLKIVLIPYQMAKFGQDGTCFCVTILNGNLRPIENLEENIAKVCEILSRGTFDVKSIEYKQFNDIEMDTEVDFVLDSIRDIEEAVGNKVEDILSSRKKSDKEIKETIISMLLKAQEAMQTRILQAFPKGDYGDYFEGLVLTAANGVMLKTTSEKFKEFMKAHNAR